MIEVYMDNYISLVMGRSQTQLRHIEMGVMKVIHDIFPPYAKDEDNPVPLNKILKKEGAWGVVKDVLGFNFDRNTGEHIKWITEQRW